MAVSIRLMRIGKKSNPNYRIVAIDRRSKRNTKYLDKLGFYNPLTDPVKLELDEKKTGRLDKKRRTIIRRRTKTA